MLGISACTLCSLALSLCFSIAVYCCPVWSWSSYTRSVDSALSGIMRVITDCATQRLPMLTNIAPLGLRCKATANDMPTNIAIQTGLLGDHTDTFHHNDFLWDDQVLSETATVGLNTQWEEDCGQLQLWSCTWPYHPATWTCGHCWIIFEWDKACVVLICTSGSSSHQSFVNVVSRRSRAT